MYEAWGKPYRKTRSGSDSTQKIKIWGKIYGFFWLAGFLFGGFFLIKKNPACSPAGPQRDRDLQESRAAPDTPRDPVALPAVTRGSAALCNRWQGEMLRDPHAWPGPGGGDGTRPPRRDLFPRPPPPFPPSHRRRGLTLSGGKATGALPAEPGKGHNGETVINPPPGETAASDSAVPPARQKGAGAEGSTGNQIKSNKPERGTAVSPHRRNKQARCPLHGARRRAAPSGERPAAPRRPPEPPWPAGRTGGACGACSPPTCPPRPAAPNRAEPPSPRSRPRRAAPPEAYPERGGRDRPGGGGGEAARNRQAGLGAVGFSPPAPSRGGGRGRARPRQSAPGAGRHRDGPGPAGEGRGPADRPRVVPGTGRPAAPGTRRGGQRRPRGPDSGPLGSPSLRLSSRRRGSRPRPFGGPGARLRAAAVSSERGRARGVPAGGFKGQGRFQGRPRCWGPAGSRPCRSLQRWQAWGPRSLARPGVSRLEPSLPVRFSDQRGTEGDRGASSHPPAWHWQPMSGFSMGITG